MTRSTFVLTNLLALAFVLFALNPPVGAAVFCVANATDLQAALTAGASNGEDDQIQIVQGTYVGNFGFSTLGTNALAVRGGWTAGCMSREIDPANTVLDGNQAGTVLTLTAPASAADLSAADLLIHGVTLRNGKAYGHGGGLIARIGTYGSMTVASSNIQSNSGGGVYVSSSSSSIITLANNNIQGNRAPGESGGGAVISGDYNNAITFVNNSIHGNISSFGGGIAVGGISDNTITFINNSIQGNGASYFGGGADVYSYSNNTTTFVNNSIQGNSASEGGGISLRIYANSNTAELYNNLFWNNRSSATENTGADIWINNDDDSDVIPSPVTLLHNNFDQTPGTGFYTTLPIPIDPSNFDKVDPLYVDSENGDLSLLPGSPMIDAGYPGTPNLPSTDIAGRPRVIGGVVDIGAYEFDDGFIPSALLNSAVLPYARAVAVGDTATAFASVINSGNATATDCSIALPGGLTASFSYQTTNAANALIGNPDSPVDIAPGATQGFVFGITPSQTMAANEIPLVFDCANTSPATSHAGLNTFILSAAASAPPDLLAIGATPSGDGVVRLPSRDGTGFFATAAVNIGSAGAVTVSADDGGRGLPLTLQVCETTRAGEWIVCGNTLTRSIGADRMAYYSVFATGTGQPIAFDPANNRLFLRFAANGTTVGATNVAVTAP
ncbi:choice-of-anchor Q domain-containing protein [Thiocapsa sp.]|uniref:choice-of-anchor Q domain-containing protein n=1 Tax=Thiocapsa sp. TaxID=2024551 RepID=UPI002BAB425E|nr:choice-of-anchor Q domain-containing protein [Thiocapsa sp.]HSO82637.1 choice-of-anchor Q domain-containing protein [Thiocapsa sp.]